jgi:phenylpyruvate tautomerase PptA (4-oxalocrotonate tautomerase family)
MAEESDLKRVHVLEKVLESDWFETQDEETRELVRYFAGQTAELLGHTKEETHLVLNMVAMDNRYVHVPNEFIEEID